MSYGIRIDSAFNTLQLDTSAPLSYLKVTSSGTAASIINVSAQSIVAIKVKSTATPTELGYAYGAYTTGTNPYTYTFSNSQGASTLVDYIVLEPTNSAAPSTAYPYGIQVFNSEGELAFDTGVFVTGGTSEKVVNMVKILTGQTISGNPNDPSAILYTKSDFRDVYCCVNNSFFLSASVSINGYKWVTSDNSIRRYSYLSIPFSGGQYLSTVDASLILMKTI